MDSEIKEILDRLERIDHKEYSCGFEFADSGSFDEDCRCFEERKKMANYITNLQEENEYLKKNQRFYKKFGNDYIFCVEGDKETYKDLLLEKQEENENLKDFINKLQATKDRLDKYDRENQLKIDKAISMLKELNIKLKDILKIGIGIKEISDIEEVLKGK